MGAPSTSNLGDQVRVGRCTWATGSSSRLSTKPNLLLLWSCDCLCYFFPLEGPISPSSRASVYLFLLRSGLGFSPRLVGSWRGGGGFTRGLDLLFSWGEGALFLPFMSSRLGLSWRPSLLPRCPKSHPRKLLSGQESECTSTRPLLLRPLI